MQRCHILNPRVGEARHKELKFTRKAGFAKERYDMRTKVILKRKRLGQDQVTKDH